MPLKGRGSKAPIKGSSSRTPKGTWNENLPINPPIQTPSIPKTPAKTFIDGIPFNAFLEKFYRNLYTKSYLKSSLFGIVVKVTPEVVVEVLGITLVKAPSMSELEITSNEEQIVGALGSRKKACHCRTKIQIGATNVFLKIYLHELDFKCASKKEGKKLKVKVLVKWCRKDWLV
ncbi:hypothetical protein AAG906_021187 [Vitis piasezkii]